ncbi:MAG: hypothetical protein WA776_01570 [Xanthobacteraceae bacterium]
MPSSIHRYRRCQSRRPETAHQDRQPAAAQRRGYQYSHQTGQPSIQRKILDNPNARVSEEGFARLVSAVNGDKSFAAAVAARQDCRLNSASGLLSE